MKKKSFKRTVSYDLNDKSTENDGKKRKHCTSNALGYQNPAFEPELKDFVIEGWNGEKRRSKKYNAGWDIHEHKIPLDALICRYGTDLNRGLSHSLVESNREKYGENKLKPPVKKSELLKLLGSILLGLNLLLWICGVISIAAYLFQVFYTGNTAPDNLYSGASLIVVVLIAGCFSYYQEYQSNRIMESFKLMVPQFVMVIRDGESFQIHSEEIVVGDLIKLNYGDKVAADVRIIEAQSLKVDNSSITGESEPKKRAIACTNKDPMETKNLAFFSTNIVQGSGKGIVIKVGQATLLGKLASLASTVDASDTPLAREMGRIIKIMTTLSLLFGVLFYGIGISMHYTWVDSLFFVIGIVVANVPENLNVTLTIILALTAKKMAKKNCLVKHLHAVETLGSTSVICSDKTGTLTQNKMSVAHLWFDNAIAEADTTELATGIGTFHEDDPGFKELAMVAALCSTAYFKAAQNDTPVLKRLADGDSSEVAILRFMEMHIGSVESFRSKYPKVFEIPFNSVNKYQVSVHSMLGTEDPRFFVAMKGAPERLLDMCSSLLIADQEFDLDKDIRQEIIAAYSELGSFGERVLGFCDGRLPKDKYPMNHYFDDEDDSFLEGLRFVGLISMIDPPRAAVPEAVMKCKMAGVKVCMITGDHPVTATAIARSVGIFSEGSKTVSEIALEEGIPIEEVKGEQIKAAVITGSELRELSPEQLQCFIMLHEELVFARTSPEQKYDIVQAFQKLGHIVAVTGDGVNDSPALKKANIGVAMGSGSDVCKEVADMILLDDNFASIVGGIEDGRVIFDNLRKLMRYTMADNIAEMYCYWVLIILRIPLPMGTIAMLISTLCVDVFPAVSLAHEPAESDIMKLKPRDPESESLFTREMLSVFYGQTACIETAAGFLGYFVVFAIHGWYPQQLLYNQDRYESTTINDLEDSYGQEWTAESRRRLERQAQTAFFLALICTQFANAICCKTRRVSVFQQGMKNTLMNGALVAMLAVSSFFIYTPGLNTAVGFFPLSYEAWVAAVPFAIVFFIYDELRRYAIRSGISKWISSEFQT